MLPRRRFGARIAQALPLLAAGCARSEAPPPVPPPPSPPPAASATPTPPTPRGPLADPPGTQPGATAFVEAFPRGAPEPIFVDETQLVPFGKGIVAYVNHTGDGPATPCPIEGDSSGCSFLRVAPWTTAPSLVSVLGGSPRGSVGAWSAATKSDEYASVWPGVETAFLVHAQRALRIDTVDAAGRIATLIENNLPEDTLTDVKIVETSKGLLVLGVNPFTQLFARSVVDKKLRPAKSLSYAVSPVWGTAGWARNMAGGPARPALPDWGLRAVIDASGKITDQAYLMLTELTPPRKGTAREGLDPGLKRGGKNGCGRPSRPLTDASVKKQPHLITLSADGAIVKDTKIDVPPPFGKRQPLEMTAFPGGVTIMGKSFSIDHAEIARPATDEPPRVLSPFVGAKPESVVALSFDHARQEGAVLAVEGDQLALRRFDALGTPLGQADHAPMPDSPDTQAAAPSLAVAGDVWVYLHPDATRVTLFGGKRSGTSVDIPQLASSPPQMILGVFRWGPSEVAVLRSSFPPPPTLDDDPDPKQQRLRRSQAESLGLLISVVNVETGLATPLAPLAGWPRTESGSPELHSLHAAGLAGDRLAVLGSVTDPRGVTTLWVYMREGDSWRKEKLKETQGLYPWISFPVFTMPDDLVFYGADRAVAEAIWARAEKTTELKDGEIDELRRRSREAPLVLPGQPGELRRLGTDALRALADCPAIASTGPARFVAACTSTTPGELSVRVGLRVYRP